MSTDIETVRLEIRRKRQHDEAIYALKTALASAVVATPTSNLRNALTMLSFHFDLIVYSIPYEEKP